MTDRDRPARSPSPADGERELGELLRGAGPRPEVPPEDLAHLRAAARREWEEVVASRRARRRRRWRPLAAAAALALVAAGAVWWLVRDGSPAAPADPALATVQAAAAGARADGHPLSAGDVVRAGAELAVGDGDGSGALVLAWRDGRSVRLAPGGRLRAASAGRLELAAGAVYVDSPTGLSTERPFAVATAAGTVVERGTQFEVRVAADDAPLRVRVREGRVEVESASGEALPVVAGEQWTLRRDGRRTREEIAPWDDAWAWAVRAAPLPPIEGSDLATFLARASREGGWRLVWESPELAVEAHSIELHGSVAGLGLEQAVGAVISGSGLGHRLEEGRLVVFEDG